jgi:hypothetical protein
VGKKFLKRRTIKKLEDEHEEIALQRLKYQEGKIFLMISQKTITSLEWHTKQVVYKAEREPKKKKRRRSEGSNNRTTKTKETEISENY